MFDLRIQKIWLYSPSPHRCKIEACTLPSADGAILADLLVLFRIYTGKQSCIYFVHMQKHVTQFVTNA